jgi:PhoH-like ATPase
MYNGVAELVYNNEEIAQFYEGNYQQNFYTNQYIILKNENDEIIDKGKWNGESFVKLKYSKINNLMFGKFTPRNPEQECAFDLLQNDACTGKLLVGGFGSGKTMISLVHAMEFISGRNPKYDRLVYLRNNISTKNTMEIGALPSDLNAKIKPWAMPLADILGEETQLDLLIDSGRIKLDHIGFIRGRSYRNSVVLLSEAQNITKEIASIVVSRIGEGSILIVEGDVNQCDKYTFEKDSGIYAIAEALKGDMEFGMVTLKKNERSRFASLSDKILMQI